MKTELLMQWLEQPDDLSQLDGCFRSLSNPCVNLIDTLKAENLANPELLAIHCFLQDGRNFDLSSCRNGIISMKESSD